MESWGRRLSWVMAVASLTAACGSKASTAPVATEASTTVALVESTEAAPVGPLVTVAMPDVAATLAPGERTLEAGLDGDDVTKLQARLNDLHFDVRKPDGYFADNTKMAIWSFQQRILGIPTADVTGTVSPEMMKRILAPVDVAPRRPDASATHAEVDLPSQTLIVYVDKKVKLITHVSSGSGEKWCAQPRNVPEYIGATTTTLPAGHRLKRVCGVSITPAGVYKIDRKEKGWYDIPLGKVYNPMFFNGGIAIHGYEDVPFLPASHGCIRIPMHIAEYIGDLLHTGDQVFVFDGVREPEEYGSPVPPPDKPDPTDTSGG